MELDEKREAMRALLQLHRFASYDRLEALSGYRAATLWRVAEAAGLDRGEPPAGCEPGELPTPAEIAARCEEVRKAKREG